jgi:hypothetical protein
MIDNRATAGGAVAGVGWGGDYRGLDRGPVVQGG